MVNVEYFLLKMGNTRWELCKKIVEKVNKSEI